MRMTPAEQLDNLAITQEVAKEALEANKECHRLEARIVALEAGLRRHMAAVKALGEICPDGRRTYFEEDVLLCDEAQRRWQELNDATAQARLALGKEG